MNEIAEVENLIRRIVTAKEQFKLHDKPHYTESEVMLRWETIANLLVIFLNDALTMRNEWKKDVRT